MVYIGYYDDFAYFQLFEGQEYFIGYLDKIYYYVKWTDENQRPSWVTKDAFPEIRDMLIKAGLPV